MHIFIFTKLYESVKMWISYKKAGNAYKWHYILNTKKKRVHPYRTIQRILHLLLQVAARRLGRTDGRWLWSGRDEQTVII